jgi:hypothetical protein
MEPVERLDVLEIAGLREMLIPEEEIGVGRELDLDFRAAAEVGVVEDFDVDELHRFEVLGLARLFFEKEVKWKLPVVYQLRVLLEVGVLIPEPEESLRLGLAAEGLRDQLKALFQVAAAGDFVASLHRSVTYDSYNKCLNYFNDIMLWPAVLIGFV